MAGTMKPTLVANMGGAIDKGTGSSVLLYPFDKDTYSYFDCTDSYFDKTIWKKLQNTLGEQSIKDINFVPRFMRGAIRMIIAKNENIIDFGGYGKDDEGNYWFDYLDARSEDYNNYVSAGNSDLTKMPGNRHIIMKIDNRKYFYAAVVENGISEPYMISTTHKQVTGEHSACAAIYAYMAYIFAVNTIDKSGGDDLTEILGNEMEEAQDALASADYHTFINAINAFANDMYYCVGRSKDVEKVYNISPLDLDFDISPSVMMLTDTPSNFEWFIGSSNYLNGKTMKPNNTTQLKVKPKQLTMAELIATNEYDLGVSLTETEKQLVPNFDNFVPSEICIDVAKEIKASRYDPIPCRNILWTGETGTGKTTEAQMLAQLLNLPYYSMNLSSDKMSADLTLSLLPNGNKTDIDSIRNKYLSFPDADEISFDPEDAYLKITGKQLEGATAKDCENAKMEVLLKDMNSTQDFVYVDSPFLKAFRNGGLIELQEVNSCKAAILKALNEALDDLNILHLVNGEIVHRNPNCIVLVTANVGQGYEGINVFSNDFIARFHQADLFELPSDDELAERVSLRSGYNDTAEIKKMITAMKDMQKVLLEAKGDYGSISPRSLIAWARKTKNTGDAYTAALKTIVGIGSQDPEIRIELISSLEDYFEPTHML